MRSARPSLRSALALSMLAFGAPVALWGQNVVPAQSNLVESVIPTWIQTAPVLEPGLRPLNPPSLHAGGGSSTADLPEQGSPLVNQASTAAGGAATEQTLPAPDLRIPDSHRPADGATALLAPTPAASPVNPHRHQNASPVPRKIPFEP
jgi:hypothetical protein